MRLSVCIPTHHSRRDELAEALAAITAQLGPRHADQVEICITDNASADGTEALVEDLARRHPIRYVRHERPIKAGANVLAAAALGAGDWIWLHSSDDVVVPGAIDAVLRRLDGADAALVGLSLGRARMDRAVRHEVEPDPPVVLPGDPDRARVFADPREAMREVGIMQSYLTSTVVRRDAWEAALANDPGAPMRIAPHFPHTYLIGRALLDAGGGWAWEPRKLILTRTDNEVFEDLGGDLVAMSVGMPTELNRLWSVLLGPRDPTARALRERLREIWAAPGWLDIAKFGEFESTWTDVRLLGLARPLWRNPRFWSRTAPRLIQPHLLAHAGRSSRLRILRMPPLPAAVGLARATAAVPATAFAGAYLRLSCTVEALEAKRLRTAFPNPVYLVVEWDGPEQSRPISQRLALPRTVRPGRPASVAVTTSAPWAPGDHVLTLGLVQEGDGGFGGIDPARAVVARVSVVPHPD